MLSTEEQSRWESAGSSEASDDPADQADIATAFSFADHQAALKVVTIAQEEERRVGQRKGPGGIPQLYVLSDEGRELLKERYDSNPATITWLCEALGTPGCPIPRAIVRKWASALGVSRQKEPPWSEEEIDFLRNNVRRVGIKTLARHLGRSQTAIKLKAKRLGIRKMVTGSGYNLTAVCRGLGVDHHQLEDWLRRGWLVGTRRESGRQGKRNGDIWVFSEENLRALARDHPGAIDLRHVDRDWFLEVLLGPPQSGQQEFSAVEAADSALSAEAHSLLVTYYTGARDRTAALAELLGVGTDEIVAWAALLKLERSRNQGSVPVQPPARKLLSQLSSAARRMLEERYNGDPGTTEALADDLGYTPEEIDLLAQSAGIASSRESASLRPAASSTRKAHEEEEQRPAAIPLAAQLLLATEYRAGGRPIELLAQELASVLECPLTVDQVHQLARRLGLRSEVARPVVKEKPQGDESGPVIFGILRLASQEWRRFLNDVTAQQLAWSVATTELSTVEELRLGHLMALGLAENQKAAGERDREVIVAANRAHDRLVGVLFPLALQQALAHVGRGVCLEDLVQAGRVGLARAIWRFEYTESQPIVSVVLPAIDEEILQLVAQASATFPASRRTAQMRFYANIVAASERLAQKTGMDPTLSLLSQEMDLPPAHLAQTLSRVLCIGQSEPGNTARPTVGAEFGVRSRQSKINTEKFTAAFLRTQGRDARAVVAELALVFPQHSPATLSAKLYYLRLHTRLAERRAQEVDETTPAIPAWQPPAGATVLAPGPFLWEVEVERVRERWGLDFAYGSFPQLAPGSPIAFRERAYRIERIFTSTLVVTRYHEN